MSEEYKLEIVNPESAFFSSESVTETVIPAYEGEIGILKDHIPMISFLKPGIIKVSSQSGGKNFYVEDGIVEFKDNLLSILTSSIFDLENYDKSLINENLKNAEKELGNQNLNDQSRYLLSQKVDVLKSIS
ncbi:MAG: ATP synthase F1 subunit epsilon [Candidatus Pelagibacter sp. TMED118]|nr:MAG: ATP synthase F1 subunit epsilon [Candidatus Pelagibacter sp. TMED118]|tara:strand:- start:1293 stop:1685 length:393 start_codon:yes stop_codon:yes gene_type:complete